MATFLLLLLLAGTTLAVSPIRFDGYQVYRITPNTQEQVDALRKLEDNPNGLDFWTEVTSVDRTVDIMVPPHMKYELLDMVSLLKLNAKLWIENVQTLIEVEKKRPSAPRTRADYNWTNYLHLDELNEWLSSFAEAHPDVVTPIVGGESYEGRKIQGVKVSFGSGRKGVFIEGGIHAREWISPATVTYIVNQLVTSEDPDVRRVAESRDWYVLPSVNPDGYVYTNTTNRLWRKTRKPYGDCYGADLNRNWDYEWMQGGASSDPCSDTFGGSSAFSEIESKSLSEYINSVAENLDVYLSFHSYSQLLLIPFGHQQLEVPENNEEHHIIGNLTVKSLAKRYGTSYVVGNIPEAIYVASGGTVDWALGVHRHLRLVYCYELRDTGKYGFLLPPEQIIPTGEETLDSLVTMITEVDARRF